MAIGSPLDTGLANTMNAAMARHWWVIALRGVVAVLFGLIALAAPLAALLTLAVLLGAYLLVDGVAELYVTWRAARAQAPWGALLGEAVLSIIMGLIALVSPLIAVNVFVIVLSVWALITGVLELAAAFRLHSSHGRWWLALGGIVSVIWGLLLAAAPIVGAVVVAWWLGIYAIFFGASLLALAWRLRAQRPGVAGSGAVRI
nr:HdeD family acid-resistance protein [uncultured Rhodopila sp.]